jgi:hypothetical protein
MQTTAKMMFMKFNIRNLKKILEPFRFCLISDIITNVTLHEDLYIFLRPCPADGAETLWCDESFLRKF